LLEKESDLEVVAEAGDGRTALRLAKELQPDVVIMDISMPDLNGVDATRQIASEMNGSKILCLSVHCERRVVTAMLQAGASGYLLKSGAAKELADAIRVTASGGTYLSPSVAGDVVKQHVRGERKGGGGPFAELSEREREVLQLLAEGHTVKEIAGKLNMSISTVHTHRQHLMQKLGFDHDADLIKYAVREGITTL
jgi:DNA-binding NarL/FixJ family response regulator